MEAIIKKFFGSQKHLAEKLGVKQQIVNRWARGIQEPTIKNARKIIALTNGAITYDDIYKKPATRQQAQ